MIKKLLSIALVATSVLANAQSFTATYDFAAVSSTTGLTDPTPTPTATGLTFGSFSAVSTVTPGTSTGRFSFTGWPTGATTAVDSYSTMTGMLDLSKHYAVTLNPQSNYFITLNTCSFTVQRSGTGVRSFAVRTSADNYMNNLPAVATGTAISIQGTNEFFLNFDATTSAQTGSYINFMGATINSSTTFRFYGWNSEASGGTFSIDNVIFSGSASLTTGLGTISMDLNANFNIYPVPNNDGVVYIENKGNNEVSKIEVVDLLGNVVSSTKGDLNKITFDLSTVTNGTYMVRIFSNNTVTTQKIVVSK